METDWFISSHCGANNSCIEVRGHAGEVQVRDSKDQGNGPTLTFSRQAWADFLKMAPNN